MLIFNLSYGNALAEQKQYQYFRSALLIDDINDFLLSGTEPVVRIENDIGFAPVVENIAKTYPLIKRIVYVALKGESEWGHLPLRHFRFSHQTDYDNENAIFDSPLPLLVDNGYHTIHGDGERFLVTLKQGDSYE
jgi:hypothetical protein